MLVKRLLAILFFFALATTVPGVCLRAQWVHTNGPAGGSVNSFARLGNKIFAGTQEIGVLVSTDGGSNWTSASSQLAQTHITALAASGPDVFAGTFYAEIYRSSDSGTTWTLLQTGAYDEIRAFEVVGGSIFAAAGISGVLRSMDGGRTWVHADAGLSSKYVNAFAAVGSTLYAAGTGVFRSTNNGNSWSPFSTGMTDSECFALGVHGSSLFVGTSTGTLVSTNGSSWTPTSDMLPSYSISTNALLSIGNAVFAGTFYGVFLTTDEGNSWKPVNEGLNDSASICDLTSTGKDLLSGMFYGAQYGVWRRPLSQFGLSSVTAPPIPTRCVTNYPNPFTLSTTVSFISETAGYAEISIVNLLGVEVARLFSGELVPGEHSFLWDAKDAAGGTYSCIVRMNGRIDKVAMVLMR